MPLSSTPGRFYTRFSVNNVPSRPGTEFSWQPIGAMGAVLDITLPVRPGYVMVNWVGSFSAWGWLIISEVSPHVPSANVPTTFNRTFERNFDTDTHYFGQVIVPQHMMSDAGYAVGNFFNLILQYRDRDLN